MPVAQFDQINEKLAQQDEPLFANPRNASAGTLRQLDPSIVYSRGLVIFVYDVLRVQSGEQRIGSDAKQLIWLEEIGLPVYNRHKECDTIEEVIRYCEDKKLIKELENANVEMDGLVIKVNDL